MLCIKNGGQMLNIYNKLPLKTKRLIVEKISLDDVDLLLKMDKQVITQIYLGGIKDKTKQERIKFIENKINKNELGKSLSLTVFLKDKTQIGFLDLKLEKEMIEISYIFDYDYCNKGYCTEVCNEIIDVIFNNTNIKKIKANTIDCNIGSKKVLEKLNFKLKNIRENSVYVETLKIYRKFYDYELEKKDYKKKV